MPLKIINPESLGKPRGYANGVLTNPGSRLLFIAGQVAWNEKQEIISSDLVLQFARALENFLLVVAEAGGKSHDVARLVIYVTSKVEYVKHRRELGEQYRRLMGHHFPAMALVEVSSLLEDDAKVEIEGTAVIDN